MALPEFEKHNILRSLSIELDRTFGALSSRHSLDGQSAKFLADLETEIRAMLKERDLIIPMFVSPAVPSHQGSQQANPPVS